MKLQLPLIALLALTFGACDNDETTTTTATDTALVAPTADPNMITTTTTTTVTRPAFIPKPNVQYMDLRTKKMVTVRVDTVHHYVVNAETNQPIQWFIEPNTTDTFYGPSMIMANGYINYGSGTDWTYDESMGNTDPEVEKIKSNENETKMKMSDGSKIKTNENETKVKTK